MCAAGDEGPLYRSLETMGYVLRPQLLQQHLDVLVLKRSDEKGFIWNMPTSFSIVSVLSREEINNHMAKTPSLCFHDVS